jgi:hypothetical protein
MNGMIVMVPMNERTEPRAPGIPGSLFQNPRNRSAQNNHSDTPRNQVAPRMPSNGYSQKMSGPLLMKIPPRVAIVYDTFRLSVRPNE